MRGLSADRRSRSRRCIGANWAGARVPNSVNWGAIGGRQRCSAPLSFRSAWRETAMGPALPVSPPSSTTAQGPFADIGRRLVSPSPKRHCCPAFITCADKTGAVGRLRGSSSMNQHLENSGLNGRGVQRGRHVQTASRRFQRSISSALIECASTDCGGVPFGGVDVTKWSTE
jgi:hypothetical protein